MMFLKKLKIELPYDSVILLLVIYPKKTKRVIQKDTSHTHTHTHTHTKIHHHNVHSNIIYNSQDKEAT